jgi:hypothetical protein
VRLFDIEQTNAIALVDRISQANVRHYRICARQGHGQIDSPRS